MIAPQVQWMAPTPLWAGFARAGTADDRARIRRPDILRFATDTFMDEFMATLESQPERLHEWRAQPETWQGPAPNPAPVTKVPPLLQRVQRLRLAAASPLATGATALAPALTGTVAAGQRLKLYQPGHQRFYLVTAGLVCRIPGLPDRRLDFGNAERVGYIVRRLRPKAGATAPPATFDLESCDEYAFVDGNRWVKAAADDLVTGEELLPMFGVSYAEPDGRRRRVLAGAVPVGKRETYMGAKVDRVLPDANAPAPVDPRKAVLLRTATDPWRSLIEEYENAQVVVVAAQAQGAGEIAKTEKLRIGAEDEANLLSWLALLDLGDFLAKYLEPVWKVVTGAAAESSLDGDADAKALYDAMKGATFTAGGTTRSLVKAMADILPWRTKLETATTPYSTVPTTLGGTPSPADAFPDFLFPLQSGSRRALVVPPAGGTTLDDMVAAALARATAPARMPPLPLAAAMSTLDLREPGWFVIRCAFERPNCLPLTGPLLSEATEPFQMASFFDPEAPARPIRINLPWDTTPAGLRKFDRNTAFMVSDVLCGQVSRARGANKLTLGDLVLSVLPFPFHKDLPGSEPGACEDDSSGISFGLICSLSIPIITICAFIMLIVIVSLLNIIFHWIPFFISCFPLPRFSSKEEGA